MNTYLSGPATGVCRLFNAGTQIRGGVWQVPGLREKLYQLLPPTPFSIIGGSSKEREFTKLLRLPWSLRAWVGCIKFLIYPRQVVHKHLQTSHRHSHHKDNYNPCHRKLHHIDICNPWHWACMPHMHPADPEKSGVGSTYQPTMVRPDANTHLSVLWRWFC